VTDIHTLSGLAAYAQEQIECLTRLQQDLEDCVGEGGSPGGLVTARTGPGGRLLDLRLDPDALRLSTQDAADEIMAAVTAAQRDYADRAGDVLQPLLALRPSEQSTEALDRGMRRLDELAADLERLAARHDLDR
jgi:DNA-binding protein YbaB